MSGVAAPVGPSPRDLPDVRAFLDLLTGLGRSPLAALRGLFKDSPDLVVTRAPGRLDLMGGIADYSGSLVLQWPLREATLVAFGRRRDRLLRIVSLSEDGGDARVVEVSLDALLPEGPLAYEEARGLFSRDPASHWAAYVAGVFLVLARERGLPFPTGADILVSSTVPEGKGVSSSAALEVSTMQAVVTAFGHSLPATDLALLCQKTENLVVGAACGVMDQMTSAAGVAHRLLALLCQPAELKESVSLPEGMAVWGIDSGVRHAVSGSDYTSVRVGAFMGYRILADLVGLPVRATGECVVVEDARWRGYLANVSPSEWEARAPHIPEVLPGAVFLQRYGGTSDPVSRVETARVYAVRQPAAHPVYESFRVQAFAGLLQGGNAVAAAILPRLGDLMYESHASYSALGLGSEATDDLVAMVRAAGPRRGLFGAKITGGGSGGTVAVLGEPRGYEAVAEIAEAYGQTAARPVRIFSGSSPGASAFGHLRFRLG